jgi:phosphatidylinositol alpha 1,6-mannosyltransferase
VRVAFFPDCYHEIDGVANTSRQFEAFAARQKCPFLTVHGGAEDSIQRNGSVIRMTRRRGRIGFAVDKNHDFDLVFWRHYSAIEKEVRKFEPDILHITGPSDVGQLGALLAHRLHIPLAASWHTNVHEYAEQRARSLVPFLPGPAKRKFGDAIRHGSLLATLRFYKIARILFAPNQELIEMLEGGTGKPCHPMHRGVDTELFKPNRRDRRDGDFVIGYVGRLTVEKNIRFLSELERALIAAGLTNFRFLIVGQGAEEPWLRANMRRADFAGVLRGEALARAYANMDVFAFPSRTDTYGNVVLEALASGVPAVVTEHGGPRFIVRTGENGYVARDLTEFVESISNLAQKPEQLALMRAAARVYATTMSWDKVFESVYCGYESTLNAGVAVGKTLKVTPGSTIVASRAG